MLKPLLIALGLAFGLAPAPAARAEPLRLVLGTATPGGGFPAYGAALADAVRAVDPDLTLEARPTGGWAENIGLLRAGDLDLALVQGEFAYPALAAAADPASPWSRRCMPRRACSWSRPRAPSGPWRTCAASRWRSAPAIPA